MGCLGGNPMSVPRTQSVVLRRANKQSCKNRPMFFSAASKPHKTGKLAPLLTLFWVFLSASSSAPLRLRGEFERPPDKTPAIFATPSPDCHLRLEREVLFEPREHFLLAGGIALPDFEIHVAGEASGGAAREGSIVGGADVLLEHHVVGRCRQNLEITRIGAKEEGVRAVGLLERAQIADG